MGTSAEFWDLLTFLYTSCVNFLNQKINVFGFDFSLWEAALSLAIIDLLLFAIFRVLD